MICAPLVIRWVDLVFFMAHAYVDYDFLDVRDDFGKLESHFPMSEVPLLGLKHVIEDRYGD